MTAINDSNLLDHVPLPQQTQNLRHIPDGEDNCISSLLNALLHSVNILSIACIEVKIKLKSWDRLGMLVCVSICD